MMKMRNSTIPIAKSFTPYELRGWLKKSVTIPQGKKGIVLFKNGKQKMLPPGKSLILNPFTRLRGDGISMLVGYLPDGPFNLGAKFESLLTGDDELLDVQMVLNLEVVDPSLFFTSLVVPVKELDGLPGFGIKLFDQSVIRIFDQYEREDLLYNIPTENLIGEISSAFSRLTPELGLTLHGISYLFLTRSEDRLIVEEKIAEFATTLDSKQKDLIVDNINDYSETKEKNKIEVFSIRSKEKKPLSEILGDMKNSRLLDKSPRGHWLLRSLQEPDTDELNQKDIEKIHDWRAMEFRWVFAFVAIGAVITYFLYRSRIDINNTEMIGLLVGTWGSIITLVINRLKKIVEKQELLYSRSNSWASEENLKYVNENDKKEVDELVRRQCANEFAHAQDVMNKARKLVYDAGKTDLALNMKELEQKFEEQRARIQSPGFVSPFYISDSPIRESDWNRLLDKEEDILILAKNFGELAEKIRLSLPDVSTEDLRKVEQFADKLEDQLYARSRLV